MFNIKDKLHRAFTIVELVVVIGVIAALAAILIPTFANVIKAANESSDTSLVKNLNTSINSYAALNNKGDDEIGVTEAITALIDDGYIVSQLTPTTSGANIIYNESTHTFILFKDNFSSAENVSSGDSLVVIGCSTDLVETAYTSSYNLTKYCVYAEDGADVECAYNKEVTIYIYTERGTTNINAPYAVIEHYGTAEAINITEVAYDSYHFYGTADQLYLHKGHVVLQSVSSTNTLTITNTTGTKVTYVNGAKFNKIELESDSYSVINCQFCLSDSDDCANTTAVDYNKLVESTEETQATAYISIKLSKNDSTGLTISNNDVVVLDLNGYTLSSNDSVTVSVNSGSTLTIIDSSAAQSGKITSTHSENTWVVANRGTLYFNGGTIESTNVGLEVGSGSTVTISGGTVSGVWSVTNLGGELYVEADSVITGEGNAIENYGGTTYINGGTITGNTIEDYEGYGGIYNQNSYDDDYNLVSEGAIIINGGTITCGEDGANGIYAYEGNITVNGGEISGPSSGIGCDYAEITVNGGNIKTTSNWGYGISNGGYDGTIYGEKVTIKGGEIIGVTAGILNYGTLLVEGGTITGGTNKANYGIENYSSSTTVSGGTINGFIGIMTASAITVKGNAVVNGVGNDSSNAVYGIFLSFNNNDYNITGGLTLSGNATITAANDSGISAGICYIGTDSLSQVTVIISGGNVTGGTYSIYGQTANSALTITSGTFNGVFSLYSGCTYTIKGGNFSFDPTKYIDTDSYCLAAATIDGVSYYAVTAK